MDLMRQRRNLLKTAALGLGALAFPSLQTAFAKKPPARKLKIGHTCITWGTFPRPGDDATLEPALKDISAEGFWSFETFPEVLDNWDKRGLLAPMIAKYGVPLRSGYITGNLIDPSKRKDEIARITALSKVVQKFKERSLCSLRIASSAIPTTFRNIGQTSSPHSMIMPRWLPISAWKPGCISTQAPASSRAMKSMPSWSP